MADEPSDPHARLWRRAALPEEALTTVKILEEFDYDLYKIALTGGREVYAFSAGREETFEVGKDEKVFLQFDSTKFEVIPSWKDTAELGVWPESSGEGPVKKYRYVGRIQGIYDWSVDSEYGGSAHIGLSVLLDVGFPLAASFGFNPHSSERAYFGFSDRISGVGGFSMMHAVFLQDHVYYLKRPPWQMRSVDFVFIKDNADWYRPPMPSKTERREIRKKARDLEKEEERVRTSPRKRP